MTDKELLKKAIEARDFAYVPYSKFPVGAAVLTKSGKIYKGCNIECASYGGTNCAERTAIFKAISEGDKDIEAIAVIGDMENYTYPCGICRQVITEFGKDIKMIIGKSENEYKVYSISDLFPHSFSPDDLNKNGGL
ncbi:cytidine deaminase [Alkaliphilus peptidifermentans]|uniref:Cytidine deaminase n=1 Tax=Alkaliphilus peptidifermentans DSM 18978 TaxID=1120976 RepID=A0A1G5BU89_9FIRM|nr:cytidine deaminase [Alkaliphilus peptidifermentans]SCX93721.1 cytidine deaminase [Alkaliphilus peptidifermentans DSM 18978]